MSYLEPLTRLLIKVADAYATDALCSSFVFPKTAGLADDFAKSAVLLEQVTLDLAKIQKDVEDNVELTAIRGRQDVLALLTAIEPVIDELNLGRVDGLIVYRGGLNVLAVRFTANDTGRCAFLEVNDYRRKLVALASSTKTVLNTNNPIALAVLLVGAFVAAQLVTDFARKKLSESRSSN